MGFNNWNRQTLVLALFSVTLVSMRVAFATDCPPLREPSLQKAPFSLSPVGTLDGYKQQLLEYYSSQNYFGDISLVLADARSFVEAHASEVKKPAVILDIDETSLSNWPNIKANDFSFVGDGPCELLPRGPCGFSAWEHKHVAPAITPTRDFFNAVKADGVSVFFITGRRDLDRKITILNLNLAGYEGWKKLIFRTDNDTTSEISEFKKAERGKIVADGYTIIANVGDQMSDLDGGFAECGFKLPNPFYFIR
jgi:hypothetical protein